MSNTLESKTMRIYYSNYYVNANIKRAEVLLFLSQIKVKMGGKKGIFYIVNDIQSAESVLEQQLRHCC